MCRRELADYWHSLRKQPALSNFLHYLPNIMMCWNCIAKPPVKLLATVQPLIALSLISCVCWNASVKDGIGNLLGYINKRVGSGHYLPNIDILWLVLHIAKSSVKLLATVDPLGNLLP